MENQSTENQRAPIVVVEDLRMHYGSKAVLQGINLQVKPGQILGYIGPNGAGKSTTVKILIGMLPGFQGKVEVCGIDVAKDPIEVKRRVGYVPEAGALYEALTPVEYLNFVGGLFKIAPKKLEDKITQLLTLFDLRAVMNQRMRTFSKGMKQKVLIIAGLIHNPEIIFLDEPMSGLDANATVIVKELMASLAKQGKTIFYSSHLMDIVERVSDQIAIIHDGKIIAHGTFDSLKSQVKEEASSLEKIFTELTSEGGQAQLASDFVKIIQDQ